MRKKDKINLKKQSLEKWENIVKDLKNDDDGDFDLSGWDCGYCHIYIPNHTPSKCHQCPLYKQPLCHGGEGSAYRIVFNHYYDYDPGEEFRDYNWELENTLRCARRMVKAIKKDIAQETA
jgi:hypothetical protein